MTDERVVGSDLLAGREDAAKFDVRRVQPSYVQVAEQLRELIKRGELVPGSRLPSEAEMAPLFGVSKSTLREALRMLTADGLLVSRRGVKGGTFVIEPEPTRVEGLLSIMLNMIAGTSQLDTDDFLEAWAALEAPAARLAARRRGQDHLDELAELCRTHSPGTPRERLVEQSAGFHTAVLRASGNVLLQSMARPVSAVAREHLRQTRPTAAFWRSITDEHRRIADAIAERDAERAQHEMLQHIEGLRPYYRQATRNSR